MFSVIFEVHPKQEKFDLYLDLAKGLKPILDEIDGFIDNERFESTRRRGWILSHSTWRDEKSVVRWRTVGSITTPSSEARTRCFRTTIFGWARASGTPHRRQARRSISSEIISTRASPSPSCPAP